jgi:signal transduction histidine kinase
VKYGAGARIEVRRRADQAVVEIADFGPGLATKELEKVFQPFYRADVSRNLDTGGVGLGLPIARATARAHGGDVELTSGSSGTVARVSLPLIG